MALGLSLAPRRMGGMVMGSAALCSVLVTKAGGLGTIGVGALTSLALTGPLLDAALWRARSGWRLYLAFAIAGLLCVSDHLAENPIVRNGLYYGMTSYGGNGGTRSFDPGLATCDGIFHTTGPASEPRSDQSAVSLSMVTDGTSNTILFGERYHEDRNFETFAARNWADSLHAVGRWAAIGGRKAIANVTMSAFVPINYQMSVDFDHRGEATPPLASSGDFFIHQQRRMCAFGSGHPGGANFALVDGSVRFLSESLPLNTLQALCTRNAQEMIGGF